MVYNKTIPFGAPSQFRLQCDVDGQGGVTVSVLNPFNEPLGNLHDMKLTLAALRSFCDGSQRMVKAEGEKAHLIFEGDHDAEHVQYDVRYLDHEVGSERTTMVTVSDLCSLTQELVGA